VDALLQVLDHRPGVWMGCDVASEGLFRKESTACAVAALRFCLDGPVLTVTALSASGGALLAEVKPLAAFHGDAGNLEARMPSGAAVIELLRRFLAMFRPQSAEFAYYGALSFDYFRLARPDRCRMTAGAGWCSSCPSACWQCASPARAGSISAFPGTDRARRRGASRGAW